MTITVSQNPIAASFAQIDLPGAVTFSASVQGTTTASTIYVIIVDSTGTFATGSPQISQISPTQYEATLTLADSLSIGSHAGNLEISLCGDLQCVTTLGRKTAPFAVTITENPIVTTAWVPSSLAIATIQGDVNVDWPVRFTTPFTNYLFFYARVSDAANILNVSSGPQTLQVSNSQPSNILAVSVAPTVAPGTYTGSFDIVFCRDSACDRMYRGVSSLPYSITVLPRTSTAPVTALNGADDWRTVQGNAAHTGYVPVTLDPARFSPRWFWLTPDPVNLPYMFDPVTADGKVFAVVAPPATVHLTPLLVAIDEASGNVVWQKEIPDTDNGPTGSGLGGFTPPAIDADAVYLARTVKTYPPREGLFQAFNLADGTPRFAPATFTNMPGFFMEYFYEWVYGTATQTNAYLTPYNGSMLLGVIDESYNSSFVSLDHTSGAGTPAWDTCAGAKSPAQFGGAAAIDANQSVYLATNAGLLLADTCESIASPVSVSDSVSPTVIPGTSDVVVAGGGNLVNFDTATSQVKWSIAGSTADRFVGSPAIAGSTLYVQNNASLQLEARRESDGEILWTWKPTWNDDAAFTGNVIATQNLVFVSTRKRTYAIDTATHQAVWMYPYHGKLAISANGILYVQRGGVSLFDGGLGAISLH